MSVGIGYDSHRFAEGRPLILGGIEIPYEKVLTGHSDADCLSRAAIDALLGASGLEDIGALFPDTDPAWQGADSIELLRIVIGMVRGVIENIDVTVICEEPKLGPHRAAIVRAIGDVTSARVNVKATTNEGMGWIGRGEGIACMAVASIQNQ